MKKPVEIIVKSYHWDYLDETDKCNIYCYSLNKNSESTLLRIEDYSMPLYIELPIVNQLSGIKYNWNEHKVNNLMTEIQLNKYYTDCFPVEFKLEYVNRLYYFNHGTLFPMIKLKFKCMKDVIAFSKIENRTYKSKDYGEINFKIHEKKNIADIIRKFLTDRNIKHSDWLKCYGYEVTKESEKISTFKKEYIVSWDTVFNIPFDICGSWSTKPYIMSFDIESYSDKKNAMPRKENHLHDCWVISCVFQVLGEPETRKNYVMVLGDSDDIVNCDVIRIKNFDEVKLIKGSFVDVIIKEDPDIIIGYNIFKFDFPYIAHRLKRCAESWTNCGRMKYIKTDFVANDWESRAYGSMNISYLNVPGRISIDLYPVVKRDFKFDTYKLDFVSEYFLGKNKNDVSAQEMFEIYEQSKKSNKRMKKYYAELIKKPIEEIEKLNTDDKSFYDLCKIFEKSKKIIDERYDECKIYYENTKKRVGEVLEYCIKDSELVIELFDAINIWIGSSELSNIVGVTIFDLSTRGQQLRCVSQLYDFCTKQNPKIVIDTVPFEKSGFSGGFVQEPIPGVYENVLCFDFASLYPSIIQAYNICYSTLVRADDKTVKDEDCYVVEFDQEEDVEEEKEINNDEDFDFLDESDKYDFYLDGEKKKTKKEIKHYRLRFFKHKKGILPSLVGNLVKERNQVRESAKGIKDPVIKVVLDKRQLGLKVSGNSFFGFLAAQKLPLYDGARAITALGRELITKVNNFLEDKYDAKVVYNDTDSSMIDIGIKDRKECNYWGIRISQELSGVCKGDIDADGEVYQEDKMGIFHSRILRLEFEKAMRMFCIRKKKYYSFLINDDGSFKMKKDKNGKITDEYDAMAKGIVLARRDNFKFLKTLYKKTILSIMEYKGFLNTLNIIIDGVCDILENRVNPEDLLIVKGLGSNYKSPSAAMKVFADELKLAGKEASPGDRLQFLITVKENEPLMGKRMKLLEQYYEVLNTENKLEIDRYYYVDNGLNNCINQIFSIAYQKEIKMMENVHYLPMGKEKKIQLQDIVTLISSVYKDNHNINDVKHGIEKAYNYYVTKDEIDYDFNFDKLHQINNPRRIAYDNALEKKKLERKNKNLKKIKTSSIREVTQIKGQKMITSYIGVVKKTIVN